jgi:hypothetical protein
MAPCHHGPLTPLLWPLAGRGPGLCADRDVQQWRHPPDIRWQGRWWRLWQAGVKPDATGIGEPCGQPSMARDSCPGKGCGLPARAYHIGVGAEAQLRVGGREPVRRKCKPARFCSPLLGGPGFPAGIQPETRRGCHVYRGRRQRWPGCVSGCGGLVAGCARLVRRRGRWRCAQAHLPRPVAAAAVRLSALSSPPRMPKPCYKPPLMPC